MFNLKNFKLVKELKDIKPQKMDWLKFSNSHKAISTPSDLISSIAENNKFVENDMKIRAMVEEMLEKEFSSGIKNMSSYEFLVDSVVNKLKQKQLGKIEESELI